jgi:hypothetical protein
MHASITEAFMISKKPRVAMHTQIVLERLPGFGSVCLLAVVAGVMQVQASVAQPTGRHSQSTAYRDDIGIQARNRVQLYAEAVPVHEVGLMGREKSTRPAADSSRLQPKSPRRAFAYSLGGTVLLAPVFGTGLIVGPSLGHFYAGNNRQALIGIGIRTVGAGGALGALLSIPSDPEEPERGPVPAPGSDEDTVRTAVALGSALVWLGSAVYDIATAPGAARAYNASRQVAVAPTVGPDGERVGLALHVTF